MSSIDGFAESQILFDSGRLSTLAPMELEFELPIDADWEAESVEFRIYAFEGLYSSHDSSLTEFSLDGFVVPTNAGIEGEPFGLVMDAVTESFIEETVEWVVDWGDGTSLETFTDGGLQQHTYTGRRQLRDRHFVCLRADSEVPWRFPAFGEHCKRRSDH